jgi:hypothetical protein
MEIRFGKDADPTMGAILKSGGYGTTFQDEYWMKCKQDDFSRPFEEGCRTEAMKVKIYVDTQKARQAFTLCGQFVAPGINSITDEQLLIHETGHAAEFFLWYISKLPSKPTGLAIDWENQLRSGAKRTSEVPIDLPGWKTCLTQHGL